MSIPVVCPSCDHHFSVREEYAGKRGKCPSCGDVFRAGSSVAAPRPGFRGGRSGGGSSGSGSASGRHQPARREESVAVADQGNADPFSAGGVVMDDPLSPSARTGGGGTGGSSGRKRQQGHRHQGNGAMPVWGWMVIGVLAMALVGIGAYAATRPSEDDIASLNKKLASSRKATQKVKDRAAAERKEREKADAKKADDKKPGKKVHYVPSPPQPIKKVDFDFYTDVMPAVVKVIQRDLQGEMRGSGTGFVIHEDGWIATNRHVIQGAPKAEVLSSTGTTYPVDGVIAVYPLQDIAIIQCKKLVVNNPKVLRLAPERSSFKTGMDVWAVGNPGNARFTVTRGIVTRVISRNTLTREGMAYDYPLPGSQDSDVIMLEIDARIFPGNSGGPLLNEKMQVVGINTLQGFFPMETASKVNPKRKRIDLIPTFGLASHVRYLHQVIKESEDNKLMSFAEAEKVAERKEIEGRMSQ